MQKKNTNTSKKITSKKTQKGGNYPPGSPYTPVPLSHNPYNPQPVAPRPADIGSPAAIAASSNLPSLAYNPYNPKPSTPLAYNPYTPGNSQPPLYNPPAPAPTPKQTQPNITLQYNIPSSHNLYNQVSTPYYDYDFKSSLISKLLRKSKKTSRKSTKRTSRKTTRKTTRKKRCCKIKRRY